MTSSNLLTESLNNFTFTLYNKLSGAKSKSNYIKYSALNQDLNLFKFKMKTSSFHLLAFQPH